MIGQVIADRYEVAELVGTGGMSSVYKARDRLLERYVALKVLHPQFGDDAEYVERFRREARAVAQLSHPSIVTVIDRGEADGHRFIVFELIEGENLKELVGRTGPLPIRRALALAIAIADALAFAHSNGLIHRDVKPQNVLIDRDGNAKVTDFGIARSLDVERGVTQTGTVLGTSSYLSPEQANGKPVTPATDVYSLGVVVYELLTGEVPFTGANVVAVAMKQLNEQPPDVRERRPDAPARLAAAIARALEKDPDRRFPSMDEFAWELRQCASQLGSDEAERTVIVAASRAGATARPAADRPHELAQRRSLRRRWSLAALAALLAAGGIAAGIVELGGSGGNAGAPPATAGGNGSATLTGVTGYDPQGTGTPGEHNEEAAKATDGNESTYWETEHYRSADFGGLKKGVGLVVDAGASTKLARLTVTTDTPGFTAQVMTGDAPSGPFTADSATTVAQATTTFTLNGDTGRYYVVWLTRLPAGGVAHVNEVR